ncbi:hypothetical protein C1645_834626 [Glomus cerebriforme]|uniref:DUF8211 domain-containing protein n=1 Tax=Glomus cerebriforme TaxID=658196 RepID=A0A397SFA1_9GLOM|nr:hypothetical protein C1645_834626 [Glomus cerebriforme]
MLNIDTTLYDQSPHSKHAVAVTLTYNKYCLVTSNHIYSNRLGTSYNTQITLTNKQWAFSHDMPFVYQKKVWSHYTHIPGFNSTTKLENRPEIKLVLQDPYPDSPITKVTTHISDPLINDTVNPQELDTPSPLISRNAQKKLAFLERKRLKEVEALQCRKAFYLHIKTTNYSYNYHPHLFSRCLTLRLATLKGKTSLKKYQTKPINFTELPPITILQVILITFTT